MDAHKRMLILDILAKENRQYVVPIYQREYKWTSEQCNRLIDDILGCSKSNKEHFLGSIVYQVDKDLDLANLKLYLVDGQQRVTTMLLLTKALNLIASENPDNADSNYVESKTNKMIYIDSDDKSRGYKIEPSHNDREVFKAIITAKSYSEIENNPVVKKDSLIFNNFRTAYFSFKEHINSGVNIKDDIYTNGFLKLSVVEITLNYEENAQEIFESINSLGVDLTNSDLIRNYLLMSNKNQKELFENKWKPMQDTLIGESNMEDFVKNYLLMKRSYSIENKNVYKEYVLYANEHLLDDGEVDRDGLLTDLYECAQVFEPFLKNSSSYNENINNLMKELRDMDQSTAYPFLLKVFLDRKKGLIDDIILEKTINLIVVYLTRRTICGIPTNSLRGFMLNLYNRIFEKVPSNKSRYYESIYAFLTTLTSRDRMPTVQEMLAKLPEYPLYRNLKFATYLLYRIENGRYPNVYSEYTLATSTTVEHIMPQNLTEEWIDDLGDDAVEFHDKYLNTLGNLSLSSRKKNSVMSDESFEIKKKVLLTDGSKFKVLNNMIEGLDKFTKEDLTTREETLAEIVFDKYSLDEVDTSGVRFDDVLEIICDDDNDQVFKGAVPASFKLFGSEYPVTSYSAILVRVAKILLKKKPEVIRELAGSNYTPFNGEKVYLCYSDDDDFDEVGEGIRINTGLQSTDIIYFCIDLLNKCGFEANELVVCLKKESVNKQNLINKSKKVRLIRSALERLANEGVVVYEPESMPTSDAWIKFQLASYNGLFNDKDYHTLWDTDRYASIMYFEYNVSKHIIFGTFKAIKTSMDKKELLSKLVGNGVINEFEGGNYWHFLSKEIDFNSIVESQNIEEELYTSIKEAVEYFESVFPQIQDVINGK